MSEELQEFLDASDICRQADALTDLLYYLRGTYAEMGVTPEPLYKIVHEANMRKLADPRGILRDRDGKGQKPPGWRHPVEALKAAIERMRDGA